MLLYNDGKLNALCIQFAVLQHRIFDCTMGLVKAVLSGVSAVSKQVQSHTGIVSMYQLMH